jgi:2-oxoglutarate/2-oxoacid ferredoxin oxidoreductase subunit alpha
MYDLTIAAFNLSERYRVPVFVSCDQSIAGARETMILPETVSIIDRNRDGKAPPFGSPLPDGVPPMPAFGDGARLLVTGSTHDEHGFRRVDDPDAHAALVDRLMNKTQHHINEIASLDTYFAEDADTVFFAYGITARAAVSAVRQLRREGVRAGLVRPRVLWPFAADMLAGLMNRCDAVIVPELNTGMMAGVLRSVIAPPVYAVTQTNGEPIYPDRLVDAARQRR